MARINPRYEEYSNAVAQEINDKGYVLLGDSFSDIDNDLVIATDFERDDVPDMRRVAKATAPDEIVEAIGDYVSTLGQALSVKHARLLRIGKGDYTLQHDEQPPTGLHAVLFICPDGWDSSMRGEVTFVPPRGDPLLVMPEDNSLSFVRFEEDWRVFIKRVTHYAENKEYYLLHLVLG